jgi:probable F420-dependent oxidoreductase
MARPWPVEESLDAPAFRRKSGGTSVSGRLGVQRRLVTANGNVMRMQIGVVFPQTELAPDPQTVRTFIHGVEGMGYRHVIAFDHVVGADPMIHQDWRGPYDVDTTFHEPLVFFGFLAGISNLELVTAIIIAPQRQTALLAKQAAEVDLLTDGHLRLGVGVGWNPVEYEALGEDFSTRGQRQEEQIETMRQLWTNRSITHEGRFDQIRGAGIAPLPVQRPIPIWLGGQTRAAYERIGRLADGWFPLVRIGDELEVALGIIREAAVVAGREPSTLGMEPQIRIGAGDSDIAERVSLWRDVGATHAAVNSMGCGFLDVHDHLRALGRAADALGLDAP